MPRAPRRLLAAVAVAALVVFPACAPSEQEAGSPEASAAAFAALEQKKTELDAKRAELADLDAQIAAADAPDAAPPAEGTAAAADLQAKRDALAKDVAALAGTFVNDIATWINDSGIVVGQPLSPEQQQAFRWKSAEDMAIAQEYIDQGGDYQRALDIYNQSLAQDPENPDLKAAIARAEEMRYVTQERFDQVKKKMTQAEVKAILGPVYLRNVQKYEDKGVVAWFYRKEGGGAAGVYFQEKNKGTGDWVVYDADFDVPQGGGTGG
jgi:hypothetical protein